MINSIFAHTNSIRTFSIYRRGLPFRTSPTKSVVYRDFATPNWRAFERADDEIDSKITYVYDANGLLERKESYNEATQVTLETRYRYENDLLIEEIHNGLDGEQQTRYVYSYDAQGNKQGNKTEMHLYNARDELGLRYRYVYNANGKLIERWSHTPSGESLVMYKHNQSNEADCSYLYDVYQNWIERRCGAVTLFRSIGYKD